ncbi:RagB/SusD family nutrient uptake outer membrane protein [Tenacibaculum ascidiaceicola]|uniref:RagB/SusD family nutrient uptake outer membrane protein n=1 Tax=Tenacibaculum ascidiaceicola TaxID=1699411 RepID=UPI0038965641
MKNLNKILYTFSFVFLVFLSSCGTEDLDPTLAQDKDLTGNINTVNDLQGIMFGAYDQMTQSNYYGRDFIINNEVRTDNTFANGNSGRFLTQGAFGYLPSTSDGVWTPAYAVIASANIVIGTDITSLSGDKDFAKHLQGEAYAIRALAHFDLLRNYGQQHTGGTLGVPYIKEFSSEATSPSRNTIEEVKSFIIEDLQTAFNMMQNNYFDSSKQTVSKFTAKALESKVAIYFGMWEEAKAAAKAVIDSGVYSIIPASNYVASFASDGSQNSIFELAFSNVDNLAGNSLGFMYKGDTYGDIQVLPEVENIYTAGDVRADILGYEGSKLRNLGKYPELNGYDNVAIIRFEEVILNYAEALFETGGDALTELNKITSNRNADPYTTVTKEDILNERRKELIFEGFRYDDLLRTGKGIEKISILQNIEATIPYGDHKLAMPIPIDEMDANSNMVQNTGYNQ